jgi:hypothetical protein
LTLFLLPYLCEISHASHKLITYLLPKVQDMRESGCLAEHESFSRMCLLSQPGPRYLVRGRGLLQSRGSGFYFLFRGLQKVGREEVRNVASDLVIAVLVVIILVLLALRFF